MRIIGGKLKGLRLVPPRGLPVRPTTDMAKEALFNILDNRFEFVNLRVLDLFSGTGSISMEFASRGAHKVVSVDKDSGCHYFLQTLVKKYQLETVSTVKMDVFKFLLKKSDPFDIIFADPPFDLPQLSEIPEIIFKQDLLDEKGLLIIEHPSMKKLDSKPHFAGQRKYGYSSFSFFQLR